MSKNHLSALLLAVFGAAAVLPTAAHATLITKASTLDVNFSASNSVQDSTANGTATTLAGATTMNTTQLAQFDKSKGVLTGVTVKLNSTYTQSTKVTVVGGGTGANNPSGVYSASGTGSSSVKLVVPDNKSGGAASLTNVVDGCATNNQGRPKDACNNGATTQTFNDNVNIGSTDLSSYVGTGNVNVSQVAVSNSASLTANTFASTATTTSDILWNGTLNADYSYLLHAAQSFKSDSLLTTLALDFGDIYIGDTIDAMNFSISNLAGDRVGLQLTNIAGSGDTGAFSSTLALFNNLAQGGTNQYAASFLGSQAGNYSATYQLTLADLGPDVAYAANSLGSGYGLTLTLSAHLMDRPTPPQTDVPEPASLMLLGLGGIAFGFSRRRKA